MRRKSDPSRVAERDRRAAGHGDRVAPRDCADAGLGLPARTGGGQAFGTAGCSRCGHGRRPRRWRRAGRTGDRFAGGAGRPRRRSAQGRLRLDSAPNPWHNSRDWLGLSELETVTRAPDGTPGPHPTPESVSYATRTRRPSPAPGLWTLTLLWTQRARPQGACKTAQTRFCTAPTATILVGSSRPGRDGTTGRQRRQPSRFAHFFMTADRHTLGGVPSRPLPAGPRALAALPPVVSDRRPGSVRCRPPPVLRDAPAPRRSSALRPACPPRPPDRVGRLCQAPVCRPRAGARLRRPLHPSDRHLEPAVAESRRETGALPLHRLPPPRRLAPEDHGAGRDGNSFAASSSTCSRPASTASATTACSPIADDRRT